MTFCESFQFVLREWYRVVLSQLKLCLYEKSNLRSCGDVAVLVLQSEHFSLLC